MTFKNYNLFIIVLFLCFLFSENKPLDNSKEKIPNITLKDNANRKKVNLLEASKDHYVLFNFWNMACEPCKKEMRFLNQFHQKYNNYNFKVISINMDTPRTKGKVKKESSKYAFQVLLDPKQDAFKKMGGSIMPFVILADNKGNIVNKHVGYNLGDEKSLEEEIRILISFPIDTLDKNNE